MHKAGKTLLVLGATLTVGLGTAGTVIATTQNAVVTRNGEVKKLYMLKSDDTNDILKTAGVRTSHGDLVLRKTNAQGSIEVSVRTAYPVTVRVGGTKQQVTAHFGDTVSDVLRQSGISLGPVDTVNLPLNRLVGERDELRVTRNRIVTVLADGVSTQVIVGVHTTAKEAVQKAGVSLQKADELSVKADQPVEQDQISVNRVHYQETTVTQPIPYATKTQEDSTLPVGKTKVKTEGSNGEKRVVRRTKIVNGTPGSAEVVSETVVRQPVPRVLLKGTKRAEARLSGTSKAAGVSAKSGSKQVNGLSYSRVLTGPCTAYTGGGTTASGLPAAVGRVAVNPAVIPYGTRLYIASADGSYVYGYAVAADTGGFVNSSSTLVDLYMNSEEECKNFGRQTMKIYILND